MHFFYLDETGCSGASLNTDQEPIFVLGGISVKDQGWVNTTETMEEVIIDYFSPNPIPADFELHAHELLSPDGDGPFTGHDREKRNNLALSLLDIIKNRKHQVHFVAIDKILMNSEAIGSEHDVFNARIPYLLSFDYMTTLINQYVKDHLGRTARGIIILDEKELFDREIARISRYRRFEVAKTRRIKRIVEFSYSIDSKKHPMIQLSDLVIYCTKKFLEMDRGYRETWTEPAKAFYANCFDKVYIRVKQKTLVRQLGRHADGVNSLLERIVVKPRRRWKHHYGL